MFRAKKSDETALRSAVEQQFCRLLAGRLESETVEQPAGAERQTKSRPGKSVFRCFFYGCSFTVGVLMRVCGCMRADSLPGADAGAAFRADRSGTKVTIFPMHTRAEGRIPVFSFPQAALRTCASAKSQIKFAFGLGLCVSLAAPWILRLGRTKLTLVSALDFSYLCKLGACRAVFPHRAPT